MLSLLAGKRERGMKLMYADASRAYFYAKAVRPVYVKLLEEDKEEGRALAHECNSRKRCHFFARRLITLTSAQAENQKHVSMS